MMSLYLKENRTENLAIMQHAYELFTLVMAGVCAACLMGCAAGYPRSPSQISHEPFGKTADGTPVELYTLRNSHGCEVRIMNYGGIVQSFTVPDRNGTLGDV